VVQGATVVNAIVEFIFVNGAQTIEFDGVITLGANGALSFFLDGFTASNTSETELFEYAAIAGQIADSVIQAAITTNTGTPSTRAIAGQNVVCGAKNANFNNCKLVPAAATSGSQTIIYKVPDQETEAKRLGVGLGIGLGVPFCILLAVIAGLLFSRGRRAPVSTAYAGAAAPTTSFADSTYYGTSYDSYGDYGYGSYGYSDLEGASGYGSGYSGYSGTGTGTSGYSGYSGASGYSGYSGSY